MKSAAGGLALAHVFGLAAVRRHALEALNVALELGAAGRVT